MHLSLLGALTIVLAFFQYPAPQAPSYPTQPPATPAASPVPPPPGGPTPTPTPRRGNSGLPIGPAAHPQAPTGSLIGPLAQLNWLLGHWTCGDSTKLYFTASQGGYALIQQLESPTLRSAGRLTLEHGTWYFSGSAATSSQNGPFQLTAEVTDVGATYMDLKGNVLMPNASIPTRFVRHKNSDRSFTDVTSFYVANNWISAPYRHCERH